MHRSWPKWRWRSASLEKHRLLEEKRLRPQAQGGRDRECVEPEQDQHAMCPRCIATRSYGRASSTSCSTSSSSCSRASAGTGTTGSSCSRSSSRRVFDRPDGTINNINRAISRGSTTAPSCGPGSRGRLRRRCSRERHVGAAPSPSSEHSATAPIAGAYRRSLLTRPATLRAPTRRRARHHPDAYGLLRRADRRGAPHRRARPRRADDDARRAR